MMKHISGPETERKAATALSEFLMEIPQLKLREIATEMPMGHPVTSEIDFVARADFAGEPLRLVVEVKTNGQPKVVREAAYQLRNYLSRTSDDGIPMIIAPYLSAKAQAVCREERMAYLDFEGNARVAFGTVFIERRVDGRPAPERRELRSLFQPKSARILRTLFRDLSRAWRVTDLADAAKVSLGLVSTIGTALREREWAEQTTDGLQLVDPDGLLDAWAQDYERPKGEERRFYTHLHGQALNDRLGTLDGEEGRAVLASFAAADWYAPFVRQGTTHFYADPAGADALERLLDLSVPSRGPNVIVRIPDEDGVLADARPVAPGLLATSPVQTYLDLTKAGERGAEGARHLRERELTWERR